MGLKDTSILHDYQIENASVLLESVRHLNAGLDASSMGVGKTFDCLAVFRELSKTPLVVCPRAGISGWLSAAKLMRTPIECINWEMLRTGRTKWGHWEEAKCKKPASRWIKDPGKAVLRPTDKDGEPEQVFIWNRECQGLIFDEVHRAGDPNSWNSGLVDAAGRMNITSLAASATPAENPLQMRALGYLLKMHNLNDFYTWVRKYSVRPGNWGTLEFMGTDKAKRAAMARLHAEIFPQRGVRKTAASIPGFPEIQITSELYDLDDGGRINELYAEMAAPLDRLKQRIDENNPINELSPLVMRLRQRQQIELLKLPIIVDLVSEANKQGFSCPIFVNFDESVRWLQERLNTECTITGRQAGKKGELERQYQIEQFQKNKVQNLVANSFCGGISISLHDLHGDYPRYSPISPSDSATVTKQVLGRTPRQGAKSKSYARFIFAAGTVEEPMHRKVSSKLNNIDALTDGDLTISNLPLT